MNLGCRLGNPSLPNEIVALHTWRCALRLFTQAIGLLS
jgi:hypothetical protein